MWSKYIHFEVIVICILSLIPWPGPSVFKISCSRESARVVRKIVQSKWLPILEKYHVKIPLECPFHPMRDIFGPQQAAKVQNRPSQWTCGFCGKSFYEEQHLDLHFEHRHDGNINMAEDAVCLADYCDIMRCKVLVSKDATLGDGANGMSTDIEIWREATTYRTALQPTGPRDLAKIPTRNAVLHSLLRLSSSSHQHSTSIKPTDQQSAATVSSSATTSSSATLASDGSTQQSDANRRQHCQKQPTSNDAQPDNTKRKQRRRTSTAEDDDDDEDEDVDDDEDDDDDPTKSPTNKRRRRDDDETDADANATTASSSSCEDEHLVDSMRPIDQKEQRILEMQRMKANCKADDLERLKTRCEILTRGCVIGLIGQMADEEFYKMEDELNKAVCWFLTCDRYWEDGPMEQRPFPWGLVFVLVMVLSLGVCFCYYIIWILFDTDDQHHGFGGSMLHGQHLHQQHQQQPHQQQHHQYALHSSPTHHQYLHSNAMVASSIGGYGTPVQQQQHHVVQQHHPHAHQQQAHSTHHGPHGPSGLLTSHPPPSSSSSLAAGAGVVAGTSTINTATAVAAGGGGHQQQQHHHHAQHHHTQQQQPQHQPPYADEFYVAPEFNQELAGQSEHYIYVTYPPELKRRLLESCYNRTTRL